MAPLACIKSPSDPCLMIKIFDINPSTYIYYSSIVKKITMNTKLYKILAEISAGELLDKITILEIKKIKIKNQEKLMIIDKELHSLKETMNKFIPDSPEILKLKERLKSLNLTLWDIEEGKRQAEKKRDFGEKFIELARNVYKFNDERAKLKSEINNILGSRIKEVKSYE